MQKDASSSFGEASAAGPVQPQELPKDPSTLSDRDLESLGLVAEDFCFWWKLEGAAWECQLPDALLDCLDYYELQISLSTPHETTEETLRDNFRRLGITQEAAAKTLQFYCENGPNSCFADDVPRLVCYGFVLSRYYKLKPTIAKGPSKSPELPGRDWGQGRLVASHLHDCETMTEQKTCAIAIAYITAYIWDTYDCMPSRRQIFATFLVKNAACNHVSNVLTGLRCGSPMSALLQIIAYSSVPLTITQPQNLIFDRLVFN